MAMVEIADFFGPRKTVSQSPPVESDPLAGLYAMQRWGRISAEHYALARGLGYDASLRSLKKHIDKGFVGMIRATRPNISGVGMKLFGLTQNGHALVQAEHTAVGERRAPPKIVHHTGKFLHRMDIIAALLSARAQLGGSGIFIEREVADFDQRRSRTSGAATVLAAGKANLIPDAILDTEDDAGNRARYMMEVDRGTEQITSNVPNRKTLLGMFASYWRFLESSDDAFRHRVLVTVPNEKRLGRVLAEIPWTEMRPINGWGPDRFFRIAVFGNAVGVSRANTKRVRGNFWGAVWKRPLIEGDVPLLRAPVQEDAA